MSSSPTARTNCRKAARLSRGNRAFPRCLRTNPPLPAPTLLSPHPLGDLRDESLAAVYSAAGGNHAAVGGRDSGGPGGLPPVAGFRVAAGGLPDNSGPDVLSGRQPGRSGFFGSSAART